VQYEITLNAARLTDQPARAKAWRVGEPSEFDQPNWYFSKAEEMAAAQAEAGEAYQVLQAERASFDNVIEKSGSAELKAADERLARARAGFLVAKDVLERARSQNDQELRDYAQTIYDAAEAELDAAQTEYDNLLSKSGSGDVMEARARLAVAQERYDTALDRLNKLLVGDDSLQVRAAELGQSQARAALEQAAIGVKQAQARVDQTEKAVEQAKAQLNLIDVQIKKLTVYASTSGVIIGRNLEPGEVIQPGATVMTIGKLENLKITVYIPEDLYGQIKLGQKASVTVDSYPGETFQAVVDHIADQAEFTPRNVQTAEGRKTTVYAVELTIDAQAAASGKLKPGMPADVHFENE
jgi:membrane fusion protein YbhG